jgi:hypothetical protein
MRNDLKHIQLESSNQNIDILGISYRWWLLIIAGKYRTESFTYTAKEILKTLNDTLISSADDFTPTYVDPMLRCTRRPQYVSMQDFLTV